MKNLLLALSFITFLGFSHQSQAQIDVTVNPVGLLFGDFSVGADFALSDNISVEPTLGFGGGKTGGAKYRNLPLNVFGKYYFNPDDGADKFYGSVWLRFVNRSYEYEDSGSLFADYRQTRLGLGFGIGYKIVSGGGFVFDIGFGAGRALYDKTKFDDGGTESDLDWPDLMFAGKLGVGYRFGSK